MEILAPSPRGRGHFFHLCLAENPKPLKASRHWTKQKQESWFHPKGTSQGPRSCRAFGLLMPKTEHGWASPLFHSSAGMLLAWKDPISMEISRVWVLLAGSRGVLITWASSWLTNPLVGRWQGRKGSILNTPVINQQLGPHGKPGANSCSEATRGDDFQLAEIFGVQLLLYSPH